MADLLAGRGGEAPDLEAAGAGLATETDIHGPRAFVVIEKKLGGTHGKHEFQGGNLDQHTSGADSGTLERNFSGVIQPKGFPAKNLLEDNWFSGIPFH